MNRKHILDEIRRTAAENCGKALGKKRFLDATGIRESDWLGKYWTKWSDACEEAGVVADQLNPRMDDDALLTSLATLVRELGHYPVSAELRLRARCDASFPSHNTFGRLGRKPQLIGRLLAFCESHAGWDDVAALCVPIAQREPDIAEAPAEPTDSAELGFVYLMRAGRYYKIGRTNSLTRRKRELGIQLPEKPALVHRIKTDDPAGVEKYWHDRFAHCRKNGEWFQLKPEDVSAFRRRRFM